MTRRACDSRIARSTAAWALLLLHVARAATADDASALLGEAGLAPQARAEEIPVEGYVALARALAQRGAAAP